MEKLTLQGELTAPRTCSGTRARRSGWARNLPLISYITGMGSDGRRLWWQLSTDRRNAEESNARCQEERALVRTFSTFPGINNVNPISLGFNLMNQNEALAHKSLARCHRRAGQLKLWGALLLMHYSQLSAGFLSGGSWRPGPNVHRGLNP